MISNLTPTVRRDEHHGFTLVEIMVTLVVISILAGMTMVGIESARESARHAATRGLVARINEVILANWDEYHYRTLPVELNFPPNFYQNYDPNSGETLPQLFPDEAGRARLLMLRDLMRMELPDRRSDILPAFQGDLGNSQIEATAWTLDNEGAQVNEIRFPVAWRPSARLTSYRRKVRPTWTAQHESAECLYLILSSITSNGIPALDVIAPYQIDDVDGDQMKEIVDSWGNPISWIRWPAGSEDKEIRRNVADEFDLLSSDWGAKDSTVPIAYSLKPLVVSPGPDGQLGLVTILRRNPDNLTELIPTPATPYHRMIWTGPTPNSTIGDHFYIDPYDRVNSTENGVLQYRNLPGAYLDEVATNGDVEAEGTSLAADNISSFQL